MHGELVPILIVMTVFAYLGWRRYLAHQERIAAIQRGVDPSTIAEEVAKAPKDIKKVAPRDHRLASLIWIAVGIAFMIAAFFSVGMTKGVEKGIAVAVWGLIPLAIGVGRYVYHTSVKPDEPDSPRRGAFTLVAVGIAYMICVAISTGIMRGAERAVTVGVWGLIPLAIGVVMFIYSSMVRKERAAQGQRGEEGG